MKIKTEKNKLAHAAVYRSLFASFVSALSYALFFTIYPTTDPLDRAVPTINATINIGLLAYFHANPYKHIRLTVILFIITLAASLIPTSVYFTWGAWSGKWLLVDRFPPIVGLIVSMLALGLIMLPARFKKFIVMSWAIIAIPIIVYLLNHPAEMHTSRGYELLALFGPTSLIIYVIYPFQNRLGQHINDIIYNLQRYEEEAGRDFLTDLYNRRGLQRWLEKQQAAEHISVMLVDIDYFKSINDRYGHTSGDHILVEIASRLRPIYFGQHAIARWGGEEFVVVLVNPKETSLKNIANMFQLDLGNLPYKTIGKVTVSIGLSRLGLVTDFDSLIDQADNALYQAKNNGRDQAILFDHNTKACQRMLNADHT